MHYLDLNEKKQHGTEDFPVEYYYVDPSHPQYHMPYHWHMEYEMIRIRKGTFLISLDQKEITACEGDILFIHDGVLHAGTPRDCIYECLVFDLNTLKKVSNVCQTILRQITLHEIYVFEHIRKGTSGAMDGPVDATKKIPAMSWPPTDIFFWSSPPFFPTICILSRIIRRPGITAGSFS